MVRSGKKLIYEKKRSLFSQIIFMKIVFFGTPEYVVPVAEALRKNFTRKEVDGLRAVVTQAPKAVGRQQQKEHSAVDNWSYKYKIPALFDLKQVPESDLGVVAAYGKIIPQEIIDKFGYGIINIHPSLLPKYRGASPVQAAIAAGEATTGVTIIKMDAEMDHGPIISQFKQTIDDNDTTESLREKLFERAANFVVDLIPNYLNGKVKAKEQDHSQASYTYLIKRSDGYVAPKDLKEALQGKSATKVNNHIRAMYPWPCGWTEVHLNKESAQRLKLIKAHVEEEKLILEEVQLEGKNPVSWNQFTQGYPRALLAGEPVSRLF